jgi:hypothetical protein
MRAIMIALPVAAAVLGLSRSLARWADRLVAFPDLAPGAS